MGELYKKILVTGGAGFIGYHLTRALLDQGREVVGVDSLNDYYSPELKRERIAQLEDTDGFAFQKGDLADSSFVQSVITKGDVDAVVHLAAQAGVRYSVDHPETYVQSNLVGTHNILEACRQAEVKHLVFASSSSVYGLNASRPYTVSDNVDHPVSLYAATKKAGELMAHSYAHLFNLPVTGLRFFTVYGPWGRPDMAYFKFAAKILRGETIELYAGGHLRRDFTYIDDIIEGVVRLIDHTATPSETFDPMHPAPSVSTAPYRLYNIGRGEPFSTREMLEALEAELGMKAKVEEVGMQPGEVEETWADISALRKDIGYEPKVEMRVGMARFAEWFLKTYGDGKELPR